MCRMELLAELQQSVAPQEVTTVVTTVDEFLYKMDGLTVGKLYIMESTEFGNLCAFRSAGTRCETPWHGSWFGIPAEALLMNFDYKGRPHQASYKWAQVEYRPEWGEFQGVDYMNRRIQMRHVETWT